MVSYRPLIEVSAQGDLYDLPREDRSDLRRTLKDVAATKQPTHHPKAKQLEGQPGLFRVRVGNVRAICELEKPNLLIRRVGERKTVYEDIDELTQAATVETAQV